MKNIFSRKHDTQTGNSKFKFWISGSTHERSATRQVPIQTDNTRDIRTSGRAESAANLRPSAVEDKPAVSISTPGPSVEKSIFPATRTHTVPQTNFLPPRPSSSRHRDYNEPPRPVYPPTFSHEREDHPKGFSRVPSRNELAPKHRTELWPPPQPSKQPGPLDDRYREPFQEEERRRYRNEGKPDARYGIRTETSKAKESREVDEDRFRVTREQFREDYGTTRDRHVTSQRPRDKARESEPEGIREREKDKLRQRERESHQREYEKERERQKAERQQREEQERERERVRQQEMENERERERQNELEKELEKERQRERQKELDRERQTEEERQRQREERERERQRQKDERQREKQRELEKEREKERDKQKDMELERQRQFEKEIERLKEVERERLREERERERLMQKEKEKERERLMELEKERGRERQRELEKERERERERQRELERQRLREERERELEKERELEQQRLREERERELEKEREKQRELERQRLREEREREFEKERERQLERQRLKEEREREFEKERERQLERQRLKEEREFEKEKERQLERQRLKEERDREVEKERQRELERQRLKEERDREVEKERQRELERQRQKEERDREVEKERERQLERQRQKEEREREFEKERERQLERQRQKEERDREVEKERERQLERQRLKEQRDREVERERERQLERQRLKEERDQEAEKERERQRELERQRLKEERERELEKDRERERELERQRLREEREREFEKEKERQLERQRLKEERDREVEKERERQLERQRQKEERERELEKERERQLERQRQKEEREREFEKEKERQLERQRLKEERDREVERERERQRELERQRLKEERDRDRLMELERERERQRELENEREKETERQKELERQRIKERERERLEELEREKQKEFEKERERQKDLERERLREERERERQRQKERERERERLVELERERERESQKEEREQERQKEIERERGREHEKQKELQRLKDLEKERLKELEQERQKELEQQREKERRGKDRGKREMARNRAREREREDQEEHDREGMRHEGREREKQVIMAKQSIVDLKPRDLDNGVDPSHRDSDRAEGVIKGLKTAEVKPVGGENRKEKAFKDPRQGQEHYRQVKVRAETMDGNQDRLRNKTGWDRELRKLGRLSDDQQTLGPRTFKHPRHERPPVADGWGDSSDDSVDPPVPGSKHDRTVAEKAHQSRQDNIPELGNEFQLNQPPINSYATPRAVPIPLASIDTLTGRHALPPASNLVNFGIPHENELARREINRSKFNREDAEPLKATESRPPSRVSFVQTINPVQIGPSQTQNAVAQLKDVQPSSHVKVHSEDSRAQNVANDVPVNTVLKSWLNTAQEARHTQFRPVDGMVSKTLLNPSLEELSKEAQVPFMRQMDAHKGKKTTADAATPSLINLRLPTDAHPTPMQLEEKVPRTALPQVQNTPPSVSMDVERHQDPLVGNTRPLTTTDVAKRTWISSVTPIPNLAISVLPTSNSATVSSTTPSVDPRTQALASMPPPGAQVHPMNFQLRDSTNNSTTVFMTPATQTPASQVRPPSSYGNCPTVSTDPSSQKPNPFRPPTNAFLSPHNRESASLPPSETFTGPFSAPSVNASPHIRVPQSSASAQMTLLAVPPTPNRDRSVATRGSKADSPLLPKKDESVAEKHQFVPIPSENMAYAGQIMEQHPPTGVELNKFDPHHPLDVPGDHSVPSFAEARVVHRKVRYHNVEPSKLDNTTWADPHNSTRVVGLVSQDATTQAGTEVHEKTERPSTHHGGGPDVLTGMAPLGPTPSTQVSFTTPVVDTHNQMRDSTELGRTVYVGRDNSSQPTPDAPPRQVGKTAASSNHTQAASDKEQVDFAISRQNMSSGFRRNDSNNHHNNKLLDSQPLDQTNVASLQGEGSSGRPPTRISWKKGPNEAISEERIPRQDAQYQNQAVTSNMRLSMVSGPKMNHNRTPGPLHTPLVGIQPLGSEPLQVSDPNGMPARPIDRSPKRSLLPQTAETHMWSSKVPSPDFNPGTRQKEVVPLVTDTSNKKVDALSFSGAVSVNALSSLKKDIFLARQSVVNTPTPAHSPLPINVEGPGKHFNHNPNSQTYNVEHPVPSSETIPPQSVCHAPSIQHATVSTALESSLTPVEIAPQIKNRHPLGVDGIKQGMEVSLSSRTPILSGAPEATAVTSVPTMPRSSQTLEVRPKASFGKGPAVSNVKSQPRNQHNESPETKLLKVEDVPPSFAASTKVRSDEQAKKRLSNRESPRIKKADPSLRVLLRDADEPGKRKPSSKKVTAVINDERVSRQDAHAVVPDVSSRQDSTNQLRSSKLSTQQLPVIGYQAEPNSDVPQTKIQHPVLAELLSSPQAAPMAQLSTQALDNGYPKEGNTVHLGITPSIQSKPHETPPERHRQDVEQKMKEAVPIGRPSHRKSSSGDIPPLREHHQLRTVVDVSRVKLARTSDQVDYDQRKKKENSNVAHAPQGSRIMGQEPNPNHRIPESQRGTTITSRLVQQPLQHAQGRHQHSVSLPTSLAILENPVQELPGSATPPDHYANQGLAQGKSDMGHVPSDKHVLSGSQETILMTPASFTPSLALKQTDSRQSNAESVNPRNGKKIRRFKLPPSQTTPAQSYQALHPGASSKTPNSSPSSGVGTPLQRNLNLKDPSKTHPVSFPVPKGEAVVAPFNYVSHRMKRSVSGASMEARNGTAPSTIIGSPNVSMRSSTPLPPPPTRDTWKATKDWISKGEDRVHSRPKRKRPRPGVVFDTDEDVPEDKQRPRRTLTKHRSAAKRHETSNP